MCACVTITVIVTVCVCAAALQYQDEPRAVVMAKMVEQAKQLESRAADTIQAVLDHELGQSANGGSLSVAGTCMTAVAAPTIISRSW